MVGPRIASAEIALIKALDAARSAPKAARADHSISSADTLAKLVGQRAPSLFLDDPTFKIELTLLRNITRDDDKRRLRQCLLDALPSASKVWSADTAAQSIHVVAAGGLFRFSSRPAQEKLPVWTTAPELRTLAQDEFASSVVARCSYLVNATLPGEQK